MKELFALAACALMLAGCATQWPINRQGALPGPNPVERNADEDFRNSEIREPGRPSDLDNDWSRHPLPGRGNEGHENQGSIWPWPGSGLSGGPTYPGGRGWAY